MSTARIYATRSIPSYTCLIGSSDLDDKPDIMIVSKGDIDNDTPVVVLSCAVDENINSYDIITNNWVLKALDITSSSVVQLRKEKQTAEFNRSHSVQLMYLKHKTTCHWDDVSGNNFLEWNSQWPYNIQHKAVESLCSMLLNGHLITRNCLLNVQYCDIIFIFRVNKVSGDENGLDDIITQIDCNTRISIFFLSEKLIVEEPHKAFDLRLSTCMKMNALHSHLVHDRPKVINRTFVVSASYGPMKSTFVNDFIRQLECQSNDISVSLLYLSCLDLQYDTSAIPQFQNEIQESKFLHPDIINLLGYFKRRKIYASNAAVETSTTMLIIDDLDDVILGGYSAEKESEDINSSGDQAKFLYYLKKLLQAVSNTRVLDDVIIYCICGLNSQASPFVAWINQCKFDEVLQLSSLSKADEAQLAEQLAKSLLQPTRSKSTADDDFTSTQIPKDFSSLESAPSSKPQEDRKSFLDCIAREQYTHSPRELFNKFRRYYLYERGKSFLYSSISDSFAGNSNYAWERAMCWRSILDFFRASYTRTLTPNNPKPMRDQIVGYEQVFKKLDKLFCTVKRMTPTPTPTPTSALANVSGHAALLNHLQPPSGVLLYGPSGCGKTLTARVVAAEAGMELIVARPADILSKYYGETERRVRQLFKKAKANAPCVLFFDDIDCLVSKRELGSDEVDGTGGSSVRTLAAFLEEIDGISSIHSKEGDRKDNAAVVVMAACTHISCLDDALLRPGRLQYHILLDKPNEEERRAIFLHEYELSRSSDSTSSAQLGHSDFSSLLPAGISCADAADAFYEQLFCIFRDKILQT